MAQILAKLSPEQQAIRARCFHPSGAYSEFKKEEIEQSIPDRFEQIVRKYSDRIAVKTADDVLTYAELNAMANLIARAVLAQRGEGQERVGLLLGDGAPMVAASLAVLNAGKIYVPMDPAFPSPRLRSMLEESQASVVVTDNRNVALARNLTRDGIGCINIDELDRNLSAENLGLSVSPDSLVYILFTSGSTGKAKGVFQNHRNALDTFRNCTNSCRISADDRLSMIVPFGFSAGVANLFGALLNGASLCLFSVKNEGLANLSHWLIGEGVTIYQSSITVLRYLVDTLTGDQRFPRLRLIDVYGGTVYRKDVERCRQHFPQHRIFRNRFASTETGRVCEYSIDRNTQIPNGIVPIGYPVEGVQVLLLDENGQEVGFDSAGEIAVKSRNLALGYWRDPKLTKASFLPDPKGGDERIFLTGDLGRRLPDGCLVYLGRKDSRVTIRGHRVEVVEVEMALLEHAAIKEAVVMARDDVRDEKRLVAYVVPRQRDAVKIGELRTFLEQKLPEYMVPSFFVLLDVLPLLPNGKVDRRALPLLDRSQLDKNTFVAPRTPLEKQLANMWSEVLGVKRVGIHDKIFDLGGHSLLAAQIVSRVHDIFHVDVPLVALLEKPTVADLAIAVAAQRAEQAGAETLEELLTELQQISDEDAVMMLGQELNEDKSIGLPVKGCGTRKSND